MDRHRILCVDDDPIMQKIYEIVLSKDYTVEMAITGQEAIKYCLANHYDVIFMDIRLPELDGFEASKQIQLYTQNRHTPIIGITA